MSAENQDFTISQGESKLLFFEGILDEFNNRPIAKDSVTEAYWTFSEFEDFNSPSIVMKKFGSGVTMPEDGNILVEIIQSDTLTLEPGFYNHYLYIDNAGKTHVLARGKMLVRYLPKEEI